MHDFHRGIESRVAVVRTHVGTLAGTVKYDRFPFISPLLGMLVHRSARHLRLEYGGVLPVQQGHIFAAAIPEQEAI